MKNNKARNRDFSTRSRKHYMIKMEREVRDFLMSDIFVPKTSLECFQRYYPLTIKECYEES